MEESVGESSPETVEDGGSTGFRGGRHGLKVRPGGLFHEPVSDRNLVTGMNGGGGDFWGLNNGGC